MYWPILIVKNNGSQACPFFGSKSSPVEHHLWRIELIFCNTQIGTYYLCSRTIRDARPLLAVRKINYRIQFAAGCGRIY